MRDLFLKAPAHATGANAVPSRSQRERMRDRVLRGRDLAVGVSAADNAAMPVDDDETPKLDLPDPDSVYRNYLETCQRAWASSRYDAATRRI